MVTKQIKNSDILIAALQRDLLFCESRKLRKLVVREREMMMKKCNRKNTTVLCLAAAMALTLGLTGCTDDSDTQQSSNVSSQTSVVTVEPSDGPGTESGTSEDSTSENDEDDAVSNSDASGSSDASAS